MNILTGLEALLLVILMAPTMYYMIRETTSKWSKSTVVKVLQALAVLNVVEFAFSLIK